MARVKSKSVARVKSKRRRPAAKRWLPGALTVVLVAGSVCSAHAAFILQLTQEAPDLSSSNPASISNGLSEEFFPGVFETGTAAFGPYSMALVVSIAPTPAAEAPAALESVGYSVPEPVTLTLFGAGLVALGLRLAHRKRRRAGNLEAEPL